MTRRRWILVAVALIAIVSVWFLSRLSEVNRHEADLKQRKESLASRNTELNQKEAALRTKIADFQTKEANGEVTKLSRMMMGLMAIPAAEVNSRTLIWGLRQQLADATIEATTAEKLNESLKKTNTALVASNTSLAGSLGECQTKLTASESSVASITTQAAALRAQIDQLTASKTASDGQVATLEARIRQLEAFAESMRTAFTVICVGMPNGSTPLEIRFRLKGSNDWTHHAWLMFDGQPSVQADVQPMRGTKLMLSGVYEIAAFENGRDEVSLPVREVEVYPRSTTTLVRFKGQQLIPYRTEGHGHLVLTAGEYHIYRP